MKHQMFQMLLLKLLFKLLAVLLPILKDSSNYPKKAIHPNFLFSKLQLLQIILIIIH